MQPPLQCVNLLLRLREHSISRLLHCDGWVTIRIRTFLQSQGYRCIPLGKIADRVLSAELFLNGLRQAGRIGLCGFIFGEFGLELSNLPLGNLHPRVVLPLGPKDFDVRALIRLAGNLLDNVGERGDLSLLPGFECLKDGAEFLL